jgi:hypothetical protein
MALKRVIGRPSTTVMSSVLPSSPPAEVRSEIQDAQRRVEEMRARGRELRFERNRHSRGLSIELRDADGALVRELRPSETLGVLA